MELNEIYEGLKENLKNLTPEREKLETIVEDYRVMMESYKKKLETAEERLKEIKDQEFALKSAMENLELIDVKGANAPEMKKEETTEQKTEPQKKTRQLQWKHKSVRLIQIDRNGKEIGNYPSQAAAARKMNWDQSSLSRFMKFGKDEQIRKKNFYFMWEY